MGRNLKEDETGGVSQRRGGTNSGSNCVNHVLANKDSFQKLQPYCFLHWPLAPKYSYISFFFYAKVGNKQAFINDASCIMAHFITIFSPAPQ